MPKPPQKIVVETGSDFAANKGDEAYFAAMVDLFAEHLPGVEVVKFDGRPEMIQERYGVRGIYSGGRPWRRLKSLPAALKAIATCDAYVFGGGQILLDEYGFISIPYRMHRPMLARLFRRPVMCFAVGAGPLTGRFCRWLAKVCLKRFSVVTVRDHVSVELLRDIGLKREVIQTVDSAVALKSAGPERAREILASEGVKTERPIFAFLPFGPAYRVGKSAVPLIFRRNRASRDAEGQAKYDRHVGIVAATLNRLIEDAGVHVLLAGPDPSESHGGDLAMARDIRAAMGDTEHAHVLETDCSPKELKAVLGLCEFAVGSRMHGLILSAGEGVPHLGICFNDKTRGWARIMQLERCFIDEDQVADAEQLYGLIRGAWDERAALREHVVARRAELCAEVVVNVKRLGALLEARRK
ncbi:polysaccharide pyruvyl transferase family protein [bacterium]|nr:polysaccharide pyruvyl transferase family protein [bacterium]